MAYGNHVQALKDAGIYDSVSKYDLDTIRQTNNADFVNGLIKAKTAYNNATNDSGRAAANASAEALRTAYGSYTGGTAGADYNPMGNANITGYKGYSGNAGAGNGSQVSVSQAKSVNAVPAYGGVKTESPAYVSPGYNTQKANYGYNGKYDPMIGSMLNDMYSTYGKGNQFKYNPNSDETYKQLQQMYVNNGELAMKNTLAKTAAATGGAPSTYAVQAATAAQAQELNKLASYLPQLRQQAFNEYSTGKNDKLNYLNALLNMDERDYGRYRDNISDTRYDDETGYNRYRDTVEDGRYENETNYNRSGDQYSLNQSKADDLLQIAALSGDDSIARQFWNTRGYGDEAQFNKWWNAYKLSKGIGEYAAVSGSGGSGGRISPTYDPGYNYPAEDYDLGDNPTLLQRNKGTYLDKLQSSSANEKQLAAKIQQALNEGKITRNDVSSWYSGMNSKSEKTKTTSNKKSK